MDSEEGGGQEESMECQLARSRTIILIQVRNDSGLRQ